MVYSWSADIYGTSNIVARRVVERSEGEVFAALVLTNFIGNASAALIGRDAMLAIGDWDTSLHARQAEGCEDWQPYLRLAEHGDFARPQGSLSGIATVLAPCRGKSARRPILSPGHGASSRSPPRIAFGPVPLDEAGIQFHCFELLSGLSETSASLTKLASCMLLDPSWLARRSTRQELKCRCCAVIGHAGLLERRTAAPVPYPIGTSLYDARWTRTSKSRRAPGRSPADMSRPCPSPTNPSQGSAGGLIYKGSECKHYGSRHGPPWKTMSWQQRIPWAGIVRHMAKAFGFDLSEIGIPAPAGCRMSWGRAPARLRGHPQSDPQIAEAREPGYQCGLCRAATER
jgi:hypothetical protein